MLSSQIVNSTNSFGWYRGSSASASTELMRLTGTGNLGIGITPTVPLHILSSTNNVAIANFLPNNQTQGVEIGYSGLKKIGTIADSDFIIEPKGTGKVVLNGATRITGVPERAGNEWMVTIDSQGNLYQRAAPAVPAVPLIIRGEVNSNGSISFGSGFTCSKINGTAGVYEIRMTSTGNGGRFVMTANSVRPANGTMLNVNRHGSNYVYRVTIYNHNGTSTDEGFQFIAIQ